MLLEDIKLKLDVEKQGIKTRSFRYGTTKLDY